MKLRPLFGLLLFLAAPWAIAQVTPEKALSLRRFEEIRCTPGGSKCLVVVNEPPKGDKRNSDVWLYDANSGEFSQLTQSPGMDRSPRWSPDGKSVAFLSKRAEKTGVYLLPVPGEAYRLTDERTEVASFEWSPDGKSIAFIAGDPETAEEKEKNEQKDDAQPASEIEKPSRLWLLDVAAKNAKKITAGAWSVSEAQWIPNGTGIVAIATDQPDSVRASSHLMMISVPDGAMTELPMPPRPFGSIAISPDGKWVASLATRSDGPVPHDLWIQPLPAGAGHNLTAESLDRQVDAFLWQPDGSILALVEEGFRGSFYRIPLDGAPGKRPLAEKAVNPADPFGIAGAGKILFAGGSLTDPPELWIADAEGKAQQVSRLNQELRSLVSFKKEQITYRSFDGTMIEGALVTPGDARQGAPLPVVFLVHGGPTGRWSDGFVPWCALLASRGYAVFLQNFRGSTGYGHKFLELNRWDWGGGDYKDIMAGVDHLIARKIADPQRIAIAGWSYGGYMAAWAITQTDRFRAAVIGAPMTDLASEFGTEERETNYYDHWFQGTPYENLAMFQKGSPMTFAKNARTPALILQGEADVIDPIGQSQQFYRALRYADVPVEMVVYPREGHGIREEKHALDVLNRMVQWIDRYLGKPGQP